MLSNYLNFKVIKYLHKYGPILKKSNAEYCKKAMVLMTTVAMPFNVTMDAMQYLKYNSNGPVFMKL